MKGKRLLVFAGFLSCLLFSAAGEAEAQGKGVIRIDSKPSARVYIRGKLRGETPLNVPLRVGRHKVVLRARGYQELSFAADVQRGRKNVFFKELTPIAPPMGRIAVRSEPPASVYMNGKHFGRTPMLNRSLPEGPYDLRLVTKGGREWTTRVRIRHGAPVNIDHRFSPRMARLRVRSNPTARVFLNRKNIGQTPLEVDDLQRGRYVLELRAPGHLPEVVKFFANPGDFQDVQRDLKPEFARLRVRSNPTANVFLNGRNIGQTPLEVDDLQRGRYVLELRARGYVNEVVKFFAKPGGFQDVQRDLKLEFARLRVRSNPTARVFLNRKNIGQTPLEVDDLPRGRYMLELRAPGHFPEVVKFFAKPGDFQDVQRDLKPEFARLRVRSNPTARVFLNGEHIGETPIRREEIPAGRHTLELRAKGHHPEIIKFAVRPGDLQDVERTLQPKIRHARLRVRSNPTARVFLNGEHIGETPIRREEIPAGRHTLELRAKGHHPEIIKFAVRPGDLQDVERTLRPKVRMGFINATSRPDAKVFLNGEFVGVTPIPRLEVRPGRYELRFKPRKGRKGFIEKRTVDVQPGRVTRVDVIMRGRRRRRR